MRIPGWENIVTLRPKHPKWDQNLQFTPPSKTTSTPAHFCMGFPLPPLRPSTAVSPGSPERVCSQATKVSDSLSPSEVLANSKTVNVGFWKTWRLSDSKFWHKLCFLFHTQNSSTKMVYQSVLACRHASSISSIAWPRRSRHLQNAWKRKIKYLYKACAVQSAVY